MPPLPSRPCAARRAWGGARRCGVPQDRRSRGSAAACGPRCRLGT